MPIVMPSSSWAATLPTAPSASASESRAAVNRFVMSWTSSGIDSASTTRLALRRGRQAPDKLHRHARSHHAQRSFRRASTASTMSTPLKMSW